MTRDLDGPGEWTVVKPKARRVRGGPRPGLAQATIPTSPAPAKDGLTAQEIMKDFEVYNDQFVHSPCADALRQIVDTFVDSAAKDLGSLPIISRAICLGIGSFDPPSGSWILKRRAFIQLSAMMVMVRQLEKMTHSRIFCLFQEPAFTPGDEAFLDLMDLRVTASPIASNMVNASTFFFGPHLYRDVYAMALQGDLPMIWVGTGWDIWDNVEIGSPSGRNDCLLPIKEMDETYNKVPFPEDKDDAGTIFWGTCIYLRHPESKEKAVVEELATLNDGDAEE